VAEVIVLENDFVRAEIVPAEGGRVRSLRDLAQGREILFVRERARWDAGDYLATLAGGWDQMFPNDDPWDGLPTHGVLWSSCFEVCQESKTDVILRCDVPRPSARVTHHYRLVERGLRLETEVVPGEPVGPCLWATHPMLAVDPGWRIDTRTATAEADHVAPGRVRAGAIDADALDRALTIPEPSLGWQEVLYAPALGEASVSSPDGAAVTRVTWDADFFPWLCVVTLTGFEAVDLAVVIEPCTTRPWRLDEAASAGTAKQLDAGRTYRFWSCVESVPGA
jgi:galactose mutarotase-like enzyme